MVEYSAEEVTAKWGTTTITGLTSFSYNTGAEDEALYEGGSRKVQKIKQKQFKPVTGSVKRRFSVSNSDWIVRLDASETAQTPVDITVQHLTSDKFTLKSCIVGDYDYSYSSPGGLAEETWTFMGTEKQEAAS